MMGGDAGLSNSLEIAQKKSSKSKRRKAKSVPEALLGAALVLFYPLNIYSSGISSLSIGDVLLVGVFLVLLYDLIRNKAKLKSTLYYPLAPFLVFVIAGVLVSNDTSIMLRGMRFVLYLLTVFLFARKYFNIQYVIWLYIIVAVFSTCFILLQFSVFNLAQVYIPGYLPFLDVARDELVTYTDRIAAANSLAARMRSIFAEPSHYASYVVSCMAIVFLSKHPRGEAINLFLTLGVIVSSSSTGILMLVLIWAAHIVRVLSHRFSHLQVLMGIALLVAVIVAYVQLGAFDVFVARIQEGVSFNNRFRGYGTVFDSEYIAILFGHGMDLQDIYLAGWARMYYYFGAIGIALYIIPIAFGSARSSSAFLFFIYFCILNIGTAILLSGGMMLLLSFIACMSDKPNPFILEVAELDSDE